MENTLSLVTDTEEPTVTESPNCPNCGAEMTMRAIVFGHICGDRFTCFSGDNAGHDDRTCGHMAGIS